MRSVKANHQERAKDLNILFIGNSYTFFFDIPGLVLDIAHHDPQNPYNVNIKSITQNGALLQNHWNNDITHQLIKNHSWDIIVLQEQSMWTMSSSRIKNTNTYIKKFKHKARKQNANIVLYETWPRQPGSQWYTAPQYRKITKSPDYMYKTIKRQTAKIAHKNNTLYAPIGDYWYHTLQNHPEINLYNLDGSHPSKAGSFLAALVLYKYLTGRSPMNSTFTPNGLTPQETQTLKETVSKNL